MIIVQKTRLKIVVLIALSLFLISCQPMVSPTPIAQENSNRDIHVQMAEPTKKTADVEQFPLPNCGGTDRLGQSLGMYASITKNVTVGGKATVTGGGEVAIPETVKLKLEIQVELAYQQAYESANSRLDSIDMSAAPGTHVVYTIVWEEQIFSSMVQYSADDRVYNAPYTYKLRVPKIDKSYNVECSNTDVSEIQAMNTPVPPTLSTTPVPSPTWTPTSILIATVHTVHIVVGSHFSPESGKVWICTGDFSIRKADNSQIPLYDSKVGTGLVLVTGTQSNFTIDGPINFDNGIDVGDCFPFAPNEKENGVSDRVSAQFSGGCRSGGCSSVNVIELDKDGNVVRNYWEQRPFITLTNTPVPPDEEIFTMSAAEQTPLGPPPNCDYWLPSQFTLFYDSTGVPKQWDLTRLPSGVIIGDAYRVSINSVSLGQQVIFVTTTDAGQFLNLTDGAFLVVSPENADGVLRLRQRNLECRGLDMALVRYP